MENELTQMTDYYTNEYYKKFTVQIRYKDNANTTENDGNPLGFG